MLEKPRRAGVLAIGLFAVLVSMAACSDDDNPQAPQPNPDEIATNLTDPTQVIAAHAKALTKKDYAAYDALLDAEFEFFPLERDAQDFPWIAGSSWSRVQELAIIGSMFDPNFAGEQNPLQAIEVMITVVSQKTLTNGRRELDCRFQGQVLTDSNDGWRLDTRILFELVPREDGFLRIVKIAEVDAVREGGRSVEESSWGSIKGLYRVPPPDEIATNLTDPAAVIAAHAKALTKQNYTAYEALLDDQFEFSPLERDAADFPWMVGDSWSRTEELTLIAHMFDASFAGSENPVDSIVAMLTVLSQRPLGEGRVELTCAMQGHVLTVANDGWAFDTRMVFELVPRDGFLRILKMTEVDSVREGGLRVEEISWGQIKASYK